MSTSALKRGTFSLRLFLQFCFIPFKRQGLKYELQIAHLDKLAADDAPTLACLSANSRDV